MAIILTRINASDTGSISVNRHLANTKITHPPLLTLKQIIWCHCKASWMEML